MLKELEEYKTLLKEDEAIKKRIKQFLDQTVSVQTIIFYRIPKSHKIIAKRIMKALDIDECLWIRLSIHDSFLDSFYVFGRKKDIFSQMQAISKMITLRREFVIGNIGISRNPNKFSLNNFIYF